MKRLFATLLSILLLVSTAACSADVSQVGEPSQTTQATNPTESPVEVITDEVKAELDAVLAQYKYEGIVYLTRNGKVVYQSVSGTNDLGVPLTVDSPMFICSICSEIRAS